jgi:hypothetical protein
MTWSMFDRLPGTLAVGQCPPAVEAVEDGSDSRLAFGTGAPRGRRLLRRDLDSHLERRDDAYEQRDRSAIAGQTCSPTK